MATSAIFSSATGQLTVIGDSLDNTITTSRDPAGRILINHGAVPGTGSVPTVANTTVIRHSLPPLTRVDAPHPVIALAFEDCRRVLWSASGYSAVLNFAAGL